MGRETDRALPSLPFALLLRLLTAFVICTGLLAGQDAAREAERAREEDRVADAIQLYRKAVTEKPGWAEGWWYLGTLLYDTDNYADAAPAFEHAAELDPKSANTVIMLGLCEAKLGRNDQALTHLQQGRARGLPEDPQLRRVLLYTLGTLCIQRGNDRDDFDNAQDAFDQLVRDGVESDEVTVQLGLAVLRRRPPPPDDIALIRAAGHAESLAADRGNSIQAMAAYEQLAAAYPRVRNVQFAFGKFLLSQSEDERAVAAFRKEIENTPGHLLARIGIAGVLCHPDPAAALPYAEEAVKLAPSLPETHYLLGVSLVRTGSVAEGIRELEIAQREAPTKAKTYFELSRAYAMSKRSADAARARATFLRMQEREDAAAREKSE